MNKDTKINMNADAYRRHPSGFQLGGRNDKLMPKAFRTQSGRSMVEMLGTLAIIGVLSLGALTAYRYAMNKYLANETAYHLNLRLTDLKTQLVRGQTLSLSEWKDQKTVFDFGEPQQKDTTVSLPISDVNKDVCELLFDTLSDSVSSIAVNTKTGASKDDCEDKNDMTFSFDVSDIVNDTDNTDNNDNNDNNSSDDNNSADDTVEADLCKNIVCKACFTCEDGECQPLEEGSSCGDNGICEGGICLTEEIPNIDEYKSCSTDSDCTDKDKGCMECHGDGEDTANGKWCYPVQDGTVCEKNGEAGLCRDGYCEIDACNADGTCISSSQYCSYSADWGECTPTPEKCREVSDVFSRIRTTYTDDSGNTQTQVWYVSKYKMNYFDALSACTALKKTIPNVKDLVIDWRGSDGNYTKNAKMMSLDTALNVHELIWTESTDSCKANMMWLGGSYIYADYKSRENIAVCW